MEGETIVGIVKGECRILGIACKLLRSYLFIIFKGQGDAGDIDWRVLLLDIDALGMEVGKLVELSGK